MDASHLLLRTTSSAPPAPGAPALPAQRRTRPEALPDTRGALRRWTRRCSGIAIWTSPVAFGVLVRGDSLTPLWIACAAVVGLLVVHLLAGAPND